jgi:hypothetical protein
MRKKFLIIDRFFEIRAYNGVYRIALVGYHSIDDLVDWPGKVIFCLYLPDAAFEESSIFCTVFTKGSFLEFFTVCLALNKIE